MAFKEIVAGSNPAGLTTQIAEYRYYQGYILKLLTNKLKVSTKFPQKNL